MTKLFLINLFVFAIAIVMGWVLHDCLSRPVPTRQAIAPNDIVMNELVAIAANEKLRGTDPERIESAIYLLGFYPGEKSSSALLQLLAYSPLDKPVTLSGGLFPTGAPRTRHKMSAVRALVKHGKSVIPTAIDYLCEKNLSENDAFYAIQFVPVIIKTIVPNDGHKILEDRLIHEVDLTKKDRLQQALKVFSQRAAL
jgi:hypothetical protein